jgi:L-lactate dehydrogenase complex protein LldG
MSTGQVARFESALSDVNAGSTVVSPDGFPEVIESVVEPPAVGTRLPFDDVSLTDTSVTLDPSPSALREAVTGVTGTRLGIASLGTVAVESRADGDELVAIYPERHVVVIRESDIRPDLASAFAWIEREFDAGRESLVLATGPSSTGDMGALVQGVHGPETVHVIVVRNDE